MGPITIITYKRSQGFTLSIETANAAETRLEIETASADAVWISLLTRKHAEDFCHLMEIAIAQIRRDMAANDSE